METKKHLKKGFKRVDYQVSIIIAVIVALSFFCVYIYNYNVTYNDMLKTLKSRSDSIYSFVEKNFDKRSFYEIRSRDSIDKKTYTDHREILEGVREATGVKYLYTATKNDEGDFIYVLDGLPLDTHDFRYPGDLIESEIIPDLELAMANEIVYPEDILVTDWGEIFVSYYPIHDGDKVIGVIGIEFDAASQYAIFSQIRIVTPIIGGLFAVIAILISILLFRRISNPSYKDLSNSDYLTDLKNRNAFEVDMSNLQSKSTEGIGFISVDLNDLKKINDKYGHKMGDTYIIESAKVLAKGERDNSTLYRIGGDEFVFIVRETSVEELKEMGMAIFDYATQYNATHELPVSIALGFALYNKEKDTTISETFERADENMYENKRFVKSNT